ncbi:hypothetical protein EHN07_08770 [Buttiauxella warmboldiae]|uniref:Uncharacterized protein n=1 Tax=Buttiauxella warmboldiae TaxID=82993 RepID=A0A3N5DIM0_9ENTR|nr:hypothetical protein EHN07_08770 [Buttiauxella warmboldiae]
MGKRGSLVRTKSTVKRNKKKVLQPAVAATVIASVENPELSYDEMLSELEAIVSAADIRLATEEDAL